MRTKFNTIKFQSGSAEASVVFKDGKLTYLNTDILQLYLLKKNPDFKNVEKFYLKLGFKEQEKTSDRVIIELK